MLVAFKVSVLMTQVMLLLLPAQADATHVAAGAVAVMNGPWSGYGIFSAPIILLFLAG